MVNHLEVNFIFNQYKYLTSLRPLKSSSSFKFLVQKFRKYMYIAHMAKKVYSSNGSMYANIGINNNP